MSWLLGLVGIVLLSVLVDILLPEGQTNKFIKGIFSILVIFVLLTPLIKLKNADFRAEDLIGNDTITIDESYIKRANERKIDIITESLSYELEKNGITVQKIVLTVQNDNINNIENVSVRTAETDRAAEIKKIISERLSIDENLITVYE